MIRRTFVLLALASLLLGLLPSIACADPAWFTRDVTVGPNQNAGLGYGVYEGAYILTLNIRPATGFRIVSSDCVDNAGLGLWHQTSSNENCHTWETYGVLPEFKDFFASLESHAAIFHGTLRPVGGAGGGGGGALPTFDVKVCDIDIDVDTLGRHAGAHWDPVDPTVDPNLSEEEDAMEDGGTNPAGPGGMGMPVTLPALTSLPATLAEAENGWKSLVVRVNPKKSGTLQITSSDAYMGVYRDNPSAPAATKQELLSVPGAPVGIRIEAGSAYAATFHIHTCTGFSVGRIQAKFIPDPDGAASWPAAMDEVRVYSASNPKVKVRDRDFQWNQVRQPYEKKDWDTFSGNYTMLLVAGDATNGIHIKMELVPQVAAPGVTWELSMEDSGTVVDSGTFAAGWQVTYDYTIGDTEKRRLKFKNAAGATIAEYPIWAFSNATVADCNTTLLYMSVEFSGVFAPDALQTFLFGVDMFNDPSNNHAVSTYSLGVSDRLWTHNCGVTPGITSSTYTIPSFIFPAGSYPALAVWDHGFRNSASTVSSHGIMRDLAKEIIDSRRAFIVAEFAGVPAGTSILFNAARGGPWRGVRDRWNTLKFEVPWSATDVEVDMKVGVGDACGEMELEFTVWKSPSGQLRVTWARVTGYLWDLYDFDKYAPQPAPLAAVVQIGHGRDPAEGAKGRVYHDKIEFNQTLNWYSGVWPDIDWTVTP